MNGPTWTQTQDGDLWHICTVQAAEHSDDTVPLLLAAQALNTLNVAGEEKKHGPDRDSGFEIGI